ncbi:MAG: hypothetical protein KAT34_21625 [Candidatus Aminicenantes bacterium]|nr:hypothetical protein [Candidatus Aminicenantes bacterium]
MKTRKEIRKFKMLLLVGVVLLLTMGCEETTVTTKIARNGSCQRTIVVKSDKSDLSKDAFPISLDDSWVFSKTKEEAPENTPEEMEAKKEGKIKVPENNYIYTAQKSFDRVEDLDKEFFDNPKGAPKVKRSVKLEKSFRWFYTFLTYREVCWKINPFTRIPMEEYFSEEEMKVVTLSLFKEDEAEKVYAKEKLEKIEEKFDDWMIRNVFEETYFALDQAAGKVQVPDLTPEILNSKKEALLSAFKKNIEIFDNLSVDMVFKTCEQVYPAEAVARLREQGKEAFQQLEAKIAKWEEIDIFSGFYNTVIMPGLIVSTNAKTITGNKVTWDADIDKFLLLDFEMWVESRIVNWWAVGIAALLLILIITALVIGTLRRRPQNAK